MSIKNIFSSYFHYLIHPFKSHDEINGIETDLDYKPETLTINESLVTSWVFVVISGMIRMLLLFLVITLFENKFDIQELFFRKEAFNGFYFVILSTILDIIFYPLFALFLIQFWEFIFKFYGNLLDVEGDIKEKSQRILAVAMSSHALTIVPIFGDFAQKFASLILTYAGLRKQLNCSRSLSVCIMMTPIVFFMGLVTLFILFAVIV